MTKEAGERSFDELASGLASGSISRGKALRLMGAALVGGVLASVPAVAQAAPHNSLCNVCAEGTTCCIRRKPLFFDCCDPGIGQVCCRWRDSATGERRKACLPTSQCEQLHGHALHP